MSLEQREEFTIWLSGPIDGRKAVKKPSPFTQEQEADSFMGLMAAVGKKG